MESDKNNGDAPSLADERETSWSSKYWDSKIAMHSVWKQAASTLLYLLYYNYKYGTLVFNKWLVWVIADVTYLTATYRLTLLHNRHAMKSSRECKLSDAYYITANCVTKSVIMKM